MNKRVLITGGTGFIGSALRLACVNKGWDVKTLARGNADFNMPVENIDVEVINMDLIFHCASTVNEYNFLQGDYTDIETNCLGTQALLEACRKYNPWAKIVHVSTFFVNGDPPELPATVDMKCYPKGMYAASKLLAENTCKIYHNAFDLDVTIGRMTNIYGPHQNNASQKTAAFNWMIKQCVKDKAISLYDNGEIKRDYLYIDDAVRALMKLGDKGEAGKTYFIGSGNGVSFNEMVRLMIASAGNRGSIRPVEKPGFHARVGIGDFWCDNSEMRALGWKPKVGLEDGIKKTVEFYK